MHAPNRMLPILFLIAFVAGFAVNYGVPWLGIDDTRSEPSWYWAHQLSDTLARDAAQPHIWTLSGLIVGVCTSLLWLVLVMAVPTQRWTRAREAAVAGLPLSALFFTMTGGAMGMAHAFGEGASAGTAAVAPAAWLVVALSLAGTGVLAWCIYGRLEARRVPLYLLTGSVVATGAFHAVPWMTTFFDTGARTPLSIFRADLDGFTDPLALLAAALLVTCFGALAWLLAVGLLPSSRRADPIVDALFALAALTPVILGLIGTGRILGMAVSGLFGSADAGVVVGWNAFLFTGLLVGTVILLVRTLRDTSAQIEGAWS